MTAFFESAMEKLGRILAGQYGIDVVFEGNQAMTDGKKITLPFFAELSSEMKADLNGYLDHEVAHCKFTGFDQLGKCWNEMERSMLNSIEDIRIEREMITEFPGTRYHLEPLRAKVDAYHDEHWSEMSQPIRMILNIVKIMRGLPLKVDKDIERYVDIFRSFKPQLDAATTTEELRAVTGEIMRLIKDEREKEKEEGSGDKDSDKKDKGKGSPGSSSEGGEEGDSSGESTDAGDSASEGDEGDSGHSSEGERKARDAKRSKEDPAGHPDPLSDLDRALKDDPKAKKDFAETIMDVAGLINDKLKELATKEEAKKHPTSRHDYEWDGRPSIPVTTRFDKITDHSAKGNASNYASAKRDVMPLIAPIKAELERLLKVRENAKWQSDKEQGKIDPRSLSRLRSSPGTRRVFKEFVRAETNNVAVEILIDMSGSMSSKMETAKRAAIAMAEALKDINVPFEVTGFNSQRSRQVEAFAESLGEVKRFNRTTEALDLHIFKSFDSQSLSGLEKIFVGAENPDSECVVWAAKRLMQRRERRKILMVLSDGMPSTGDANRAILNGDLKRKVQLIQKSGIECVGIGIETDAVKLFYPDHIILNSVKDLPRSAMRKLSKIIGG